MARYTKKDADGRYDIESVNGKLESDKFGHTYGEAIDRFAELENADVAPRAEFDRVARELERVEALYFAKDTQLEARVCEDRAEIESLQAIHADAIESLRLAAEANKDMQAEIEKLGRDRYQLLPDGRLELIPRTDINAIKAEAIKEFAQRLKKKMYPYNGVDKKKYAINAYAAEQAIECIAKEMTEENK